MASHSLTLADAPSTVRDKLDRKPHPAAAFAFFAVLAAGLFYAGASILIDTRSVGEPLALGAFAFLGVALLTALAFEFVNGFHDTANAEIGRAHV